MTTTTNSKESEASLQNRLDNLQRLTKDLGFGDDGSVGLKVDKSSVHGVGVFATKDFKKGDLILRNKAFGSCTKDRTICDGCFKTTNKNISENYRIEKLNICAGCNRVRYCSKECQMRSWHSYHKEECKRLKHAGEMDLCYLPFRAFLIHFVGYSNKHSGSLEILHHINNESAPKNQKEVDYYAPIILHYVNVLGVQNITASFVEKAVKNLLISSLIKNYDDSSMIESLFPVRTIFNHKCDANALFLHNRGMGLFVAKEDIKKGDEVFIPYTNSLTKTMQYGFLTNVFGLHCECSDCQSIAKGSQEKYLRCNDISCNGRVDIIAVDDETVVKQQQQPKEKLSKKQLKKQEEKINKKKIKSASCLKCNQSYDVAELEKDEKSFKTQINAEFYKAPADVKEVMLEAYFKRFHDLDPFLFHSFFTSHLVENNLNLIKRQELTLMSYHSEYSPEALLFYSELKNMSEYAKQKADYLECLYALKEGDLSALKPPASPMKIDNPDKFWDNKYI